METKHSILISGGLGFIFSHVTEYFVKKGWDVTVIDNLMEGSHPELIDGSFKFIKMDVSNEDIIDVIVQINPEFIIHAAAVSCVDTSLKEPHKTFKKNTLSNLNLFEAARLVPSLKKFLYVSTDEVFGECEHRKVETELLFPRNPYSASKATGSVLRIAYDNSYPELRDKTVETRFCNVVGKRQDSRKILPRIVEALKTGNPVPVHNGGEGFREYLFVENIPPLLELLLDKGDRVYNVTDNALFSVNQLIKKVEQLVGKKVPVVTSERQGMDFKYQLDASRVRSIGWKPKVKFHGGLIQYLTEELK